MASAATAPAPVRESSVRAKLSRRPRRPWLIAFGLIVIAGLIYICGSLARDLSGTRVPSALPFFFLGSGLLIALGFEFVNGFHDTANAVATVIYTNTLEPHAAVIWSGLWNFLGVVTSSGAVAYSIISLLPLELVLDVGTGASFAMVFALLTAAILWNLGTWWYGLPASSSHTLIGAIMGAGLANQLLSAKPGTSGVDWAQAANIGRSLLLSPLIGFLLGSLLLIVMRMFVREGQLYRAPEPGQKPPLWIRAMLMLTCTGVSFFHGSNDGQKGMGLIMLILIATVPAGYALNQSVSYEETQSFIALSQQAQKVLDAHSDGEAGSGDPRAAVGAYVRTHQLKSAAITGLRRLVGAISRELHPFKELRNVPESRMHSLRNDLYLSGEALRLMAASGRPAFTEAERQQLKNYEHAVQRATRFIPVWVKVAVALALGLGTMVGWKRIVVTVGEKIGKDHLTYGQGAAAEVTAMATIGAADVLGLPVSTTHVLSSAVAGTMAANRSGLQASTIRNLAMAWVLTLPVSMLLSGVLFWLFRMFAR